LEIEDGRLIRLCYATTRQGMEGGRVKGVASRGWKLRTPTGVASRHPMNFQKLCVLCVLCGLIPVNSHRGNRPGCVGCVDAARFLLDPGRCELYRYSQGSRNARGLRGWRNLRVVQLVHLLFQCRAGNGLGRVVRRPDGNGTRAQDGAQTQKDSGFHNLFHNVELLEKVNR